MSAVMNQDKLKALVAELAKDIKTEKDLGALTQQLVKLTVETALNAELDEHLGYEKHAPATRWAANCRTSRRPSAAWFTSGRSQATWRTTPTSRCPPS